MNIKKIIIYCFCLLAIVVTLILLVDAWISYRTKAYIYEDYSQLPYRPVGVLLGTAKYVTKGGINAFYKNRIEGSILLYQQKKVDYLLVSGDNALLSYNEPITMRRDLLKAGVPDSSIVLDYAGFRTLDSVVRANKVFDADNFTIITQRFHCERALFIAQAQGIKAQCYAVASPDKMFMVRLREVFARLAAVIDIYILNKEPKFLGPSLPIIHTDNDDNNIE